MEHNRKALPDMAMAARSSQAGGLVREHLALLGRVGAVRTDCWDKLGRSACLGAYSLPAHSSTAGRVAIHHGTP